jgi:plasmid rolling circle replication initiator protein Rep
MKKQTKEPLKPSKGVKYSKNVDTSEQISAAQAATYNIQNHNEHHHMHILLVSPTTTTNKTQAATKTRVTGIH